MLNETGSVALSYKTNSEEAIVNAANRHVNIERVYRQY